MSKAGKPKEKNISDGENKMYLITIHASHPLFYKKKILQKQLNTMQEVTNYLYKTNEIYAIFGYRIESVLN